MTARPLSDDLYVLRFLTGESFDDDAQACEYRLLCSGTLAAGDLKKPSSRTLLVSPVEWVVASEVYERVPVDLPQESIMRFQVSRLKRTVGDTQFSYYADDELAHDMAALLSLLSRRLITVSGCSAYRIVGNASPRQVLELPQPLLTNLQVRHWPNQPTIITRQHPWDEEATAIDYNPYPKAFDRDGSTRLLLALPHVRASKSIVLAARLYAQALALLHQEPDTAYLLITMAMECVASQAIDAIKTDQEIRDSVPADFEAYMTTLGVSKTEVQEAYIKTVSRHGRPTYQFRAFAERFHTPELFTADDLFRTSKHGHWLPTEDKVKTAAMAIYQQRSKFVHEGQPYPATISLGLAPKVDTRAFQVDPKKGPSLPPLPWAERLAHLCIVNYWRQEVLSLTAGDSEQVSPSGQRD